MILIFAITAYKSKNLIINPYLLRLQRFFLILAFNFSFEMIKTFRKLRQSLISTDTNIKYLKYAIGEIFLVVIGILIALGINNANQRSKDRNTEKDLTSNINSEFLQNRTILKDREKDLSESESATRELLKLMNKDIPSSSNKSIDSTIYEVIDYSKFIPAQITVTELIQTGKIALIRNLKLKEALLAWSLKLENSNNAHSLFEKWIEETILPYLSKNIALKNVDMFSSMGFTEGSTFDNGYSQVFRNREFENILDNHLYHHSLMKTEYESLKVIINEIIQLSVAH